jgi:hypothetical protein
MFLYVIMQNLNLGFYFLMGGAITLVFTGIAYAISPPQRYEQRYQAKQESLGDQLSRTDFRR